jgi:uncharacterized RDD family membrane protein YckC
MSGHDRFDNFFDAPGAPRAEERPELFADLLARRAGAFLIDIVIILILTAILTVIVFILGIFTLGLAWLALPLPFLGILIAYYGFSLASTEVATPGQRVTGVTFVGVDGARPAVWQAVAHPIFLFVTVSVLTPLVLIVGLLNPRKRLLHDYLSGLVAVARVRL